MSRPLVNKDLVLVTALILYLIEVSVYYYLDVTSLMPQGTLALSMILLIWLKRFNRINRWYETPVNFLRKLK